MSFIGRAAWIGGSMCFGSFIYFGLTSLESMAWALSTLKCQNRDSNCFELRSLLEKKLC